MADHLISRLYRWRESISEKKVWTFLNDTGSEVDSFTYLELDLCSSGLAEHFVSDKCRLKKGDRALLVFFPGLEFMLTLLACFKAGIIAVPVFPPDPRRLKKDLVHFASIQKSSGATVALTHKSYSWAKNMAGAASIFSSSGESWPEMTWIPIDSTLAEYRALARKSPVGEVQQRSKSMEMETEGGDIAFLQYTSGSTSEPKGVMISHDNLAHNLCLIVTELKADESTVNVSWLPQYHDMGLIGSYLGLLYCGGRGVYLSPISFLKDPTCWLRTLSTYKGTHTQAPNFAYALSVRKFKESAKRSPADSLEGLDLSSVRHMINAAEPVDAIAVVDFYDTFGKYNLPEGVVIPTYGLAEHCVFVCSDGKQVLVVDKALLGRHCVHVHESFETVRSYSEHVRGHRDRHEKSLEFQVVVGCGYPHKDPSVDVRIVDPESGEEISRGGGSSTSEEQARVGEVWVSSPSRAQGYWNQPELTKEQFKATLTCDEGNSGDEDSGAAGSGFLRTGDLGFYYRQELFICGRIKDLIIVRGSNHYPQDIERTAEKACASSLRAGCSAAFAVRDEMDLKQGSGEGFLLQQAVRHYAQATGGGKNSPGSNTQGSGSEIVVYVAEVKPEVKAAAHSGIMAEVRKAVSQDHGLAVAVVLLLKPRTVPKTTSGKITRAGCKKQLFEKGLSVLAVWRGEGSSDAAPAAPSPSAAVEDVTLTVAGEEGERLLPLPGTRAGDSPDNSHASIRPGLTVEQVKGMERKDIHAQLEAILCDITSTSPNPLSPPVEPNASLLSLGVDSMTIAQFKGAIDNIFYATCIPDDFMFSSLAHLNGISLAIKMQELTPEQKRKFEEALAGEEGEGEDGPIMHKEPMCPWYICCQD